MITPLHEAVQNRDLTAVRILLREGHDPDARDAKGNAPIHLAALNYDNSIVDALVDAGGSEAIVDGGGTPANEYHALRRRSTYRPYLDEDDAMREVHRAARESSGRLRALLEGGADHSERDEFDRTPLHYAARHGATNNVVLLLSCEDVDPDAGDDEFRTAAHFAARMDDVATLEALWKSGANLDARDGAYETPLHYAAVMGSLQAIDFLLSRGVTVDAYSDDDNTPLHLSAANYQVEATEALLLAGADIRSLDEDGMTIEDVYEISPVREQFIGVLMRVSKQGDLLGFEDDPSGIE